MMQTKKFEGLIAAPFAPMDEMDNVVYDRIPMYYNFLKKNKVVGAFINGSTGEGVSLTQKERMNIAEQWVGAAKKNPGVKIINLVGGTSYAECIENAQHSAEIGMDAIALLAPYYFKPSGATQLAEFVGRVAETVPKMPVYFYHIPVLTGCYVSMYDFLKEVAPAIPNLAGIKYTHEDFMDFQSCINFMDGKYEMLWGRDENLLSALVLGTRSGVGSTYNYAAPLYYKLIEAFDSGNLVLARQLQQKAINMIRLLGKYGGIATGKAYMRYVGFDCGEFRSPVKNMSRDDYKKFAEDVKALAMEEEFSKIAEY
jgi:N-acetylneuraminate lyase